MDPRIKEEYDALSKEELKEFRRRIVQALPKKQQLALLGDPRVERMSQGEYEQFVYTQFQLYKQEQVLKKQQATQEPMVQATG